MSDASDRTPSFSLDCDSVFNLPVSQTGDGGISFDQVTHQIKASLANPTNYPSLVDSIVPGDHVVLAVDPTVPQLRDVIAGVILALGETEAGQIDAVLWDEATEEQIAMVGEEMGPSSKVIRHHGDLRRDVRYLAADQSADPIYVNRLLVDADLVLPIASGRLVSDQEQQDRTGIYPMLVDSASRKRFASGAAQDVAASQTAWLLGVQMMLSVVPGLPSSNGVDGQVDRILAGAIGWVGEQLAEQAEAELSSREQADLVVAVVEQGTTQTWDNAIRAIQAAATIAAEDATIVLWSQINDPIPSISQDALEEDDDLVVADIHAENSEAPGPDADEDFPAWNADVALARELAELSSKFRLLIRSQLDDEAVEMAGFGAIADVDQLNRLSRGFGVGCVLRRASYLASAASTPGSVRVEK